MNMRIDDILPSYYEASLVIPVVLDADRAICKVLLAREVRHIGVGKWNGFGGRYELDDTDKVIGALRELNEEIGITAKPVDMWHAGILDIYTARDVGPTSTVCKVYVYIAYVERNVLLTPCTREVENPTWFSVDDVPLDEMMPADKH